MSGESSGNGLGVKRINWNVFRSQLRGAAPAAPLCSALDFGPPGGAKIDEIFDSVFDRSFSSKIVPKVPKIVVEVAKMVPEMVPKSCPNRIFSKNVKTSILNNPPMVLLDFSCSGVPKIDE